MTKLVKELILGICFLAFSFCAKAQFSSGNGTSGSPYQIATDTELAQLATYVNAGNATYADSGVYYQLANNIDLSAYSNWIPIGNTTTNTFKGVFDGDSNQITNLKITSGGCAGLFGYTYHATVKNLGLVNININCMYNSNARVGGLVANNQGTVSNCYVIGMVQKTTGGSSASSMSEYAYVGGLVGDNQGSVLNCYSNCTIIAACSVSSSMGNYRTYSRAGGVVGYNQSDGNVSNCYATGTVTTDADTRINEVGDIYSYSYAGGVSGENIGIISNCYATDSVSASAYSFAPNSTRSIYAYARTGGIVGYNQGNGTVSNCYAIGYIKASSTSKSTTVYGNNSSYNYPYSYVGGVVGQNGSSGSSVSNCAGLNPKISCTSTSIDGHYSTTYKYYGRVVGSNTGLLSNNMAFDSIINPSNTTSWSNIGTSDLSGASYTKTDINTDSTLGGLFTTPMWTTLNSKLPGLLGNTVDMPTHLYIAPTPPSITTTTLPNGVIGTAYSQALSATGTIPIAWSIANGSSLPSGLLLIGDTISGTSDTTGTFAFLVIAINSEGSDTAQLSITIAKATQTVPAAPTLADKTFTTITLDTIFGCEYNINGGTYQGSSIFSGLTPGISYTFTQRKAETVTHLASQASPSKSFSTDSAILVGEVTISGNAIFGQNLTVNISNLISTPTLSNLGKLSYQWKRDTTNIGTSSSYTLVKADIGNTITVTVRAANCIGSINSNSTTAVAKATQATPTAPTLNINTQNSITLNYFTGCEYRRDNGNWQTSTTFSGLEPNTSYSFTQRKVETSTHFASPTSPAAIFKTREEVSINENLLGSIKVYPNPTDAMLKIETGEFKIKNMEIFDIYGKNVGINTPVFTQNSVSENVIDISYLSAGIYFVRLTTETGKIVKKIIKE